MARGRPPEGCSRRIGGHLVLGSRGYYHSVPPASARKYDQPLLRPAVLPSLDVALSDCGILVRRQAVSPSASTSTTPSPFAPAQMVSRILVLVLALAVGSANAANDLCTVSSAYTPDASSTVDGCGDDGGAGASCVGDEWKCSALVAMIASGYSADISTCGDTAFDGPGNTEKAFTQFLGSKCCSDKESVCGKAVRGLDGLRMQTATQPPPAARLITLAPAHHPPMHVPDSFNEYIDCHRFKRRAATRWVDASN